MDTLDKLAFVRRDGNNGHKNSTLHHAKKEAFWREAIEKEKTTARLLREQSTAEKNQIKIQTLVVLENYKTRLNDALQEARETSVALQTFTDMSAANESKLFYIWNEIKRLNPLFYELLENNKRFVCMGKRSFCNYKNDELYIPLDLAAELESMVVNQSSKPLASYLASEEYNKKPFTRRILAKDEIETFDGSPDCDVDSLFEKKRMRTELSRLYSQLHSLLLSESGLTEQQCELVDRVFAEHGLKVNGVEKDNHLAKENEDIDDASSNGSIKVKQIIKGIESKIGFKSTEKKPAGESRYLADLPTNTASNGEALLEGLKPSNLEHSTKRKKHKKALSHGMNDKENSFPLFFDSSAPHVSRPLSPCTPAHLFSAAQPLPTTAAQPKAKKDLFAKSGSNKKQRGVLPSSSAAAVMSAKKRLEWSDSTLFDDLECQRALGAKLSQELAATAQVTQLRRDNFFLQDELDAMTQKLRQAEECIERHQQDRETMRKGLLSLRVSLIEERCSAAARQQELESQLAALRQPVDCSDSALGRMDDIYSVEESFELNFIHRDRLHPCDENGDPLDFEGEEERQLVLYGRSRSPGSCNSESNEWLSAIRELSNDKSELTQQLLEALDIAELQRIEVANLRSAIELLTAQPLPQKQEPESTCEACELSAIRLNYRSNEIECLTAQILDVLQIAEAQAEALRSLQNSAEVESISSDRFDDDSPVVGQIENENDVDIAGLDATTGLFVVPDDAKPVDIEMSMTAKAVPCVEQAIRALHMEMIRTKLATYEEKLTETSNQCNQLREESIGMTSEIKILKHDVESLNEKLSVSQSELSAWNSKYGVLQSEAARLREKHEETSLQSKQYIETLQQEVNALKDLLESASADSDRVVAALHEERKKISNKIARMAASRQEERAALLDQLAVERANAAANQLALQSELTKLQQQYEAAMVTSFNNLIASLKQDIEINHNETAHAINNLRLEAKQLQELLEATKATSSHTIEVLKREISQWRDQISSSSSESTKIINILREEARKMKAQKDAMVDESSILISNLQKELSELVDEITQAKVQSQRQITELREEREKRNEQLTKMVSTIEDEKKKLKHQMEEEQTEFIRAVQRIQDDLHEAYMESEKGGKPMQIGVDMQRRLHELQEDVRQLNGGNGFNFELGLFATECKEQSTNSEIVLMMASELQSLQVEFKLLSRSKCEMERSFKEQFAAMEQELADSKALEKERSAANSREFTKKMKALQELTKDKLSTAFEEQTRLVQQNFESQAAELANCKARVIELVFQLEESTQELAEYRRMSSEAASANSEQLTMQRELLDQMAAEKAEAKKESSRRMAFMQAEIERLQVKEDEMRMQLLQLKELSKDRAVRSIQKIKKLQAELDAKRDGSASLVVHSPGSDSTATEEEKQHMQAMSSSQECVILKAEMTELRTKLEKSCRELLRMKSVMRSDRQYYSKLKQTLGMLAAKHLIDLDDKKPLVRKQSSNGDNGSSDEREEVYNLCVMQAAKQLQENQSEEDLEFMQELGSIQESLDRSLFEIRAKK